jgi:hypothetical protein
VLSVLAALASLLRGKRYIHGQVEAEELGLVDQQLREEAPTK